MWILIKWIVLFRSHSWFIANVWKQLYTDSLNCLFVLNEQNSSLSKIVKCMTIIIDNWLIFVHVENKHIIIQMPLFKRTNGSHTLLHSSVPYSLTVRVGGCLFNNTCSIIEINGMDIRNIALSVGAIQSRCSVCHLYVYKTFSTPNIFFL